MVSHAQHCAHNKSAHLSKDTNVNTPISFTRCVISPVLKIYNQPESMSGRNAPDNYVLTPEQIDTFHKDGCVTLLNVLTEEEVCEIEKVFNKL